MSPCRAAVHVFAPRDRAGNHAWPPSPIIATAGVARVGAVSALAVGLLMLSVGLRPGGESSTIPFFYVILAKSVRMGEGRQTQGG